MQHVGMMVRHAYEVDAAVRLVDMPVFIHKAEILRLALPAGMQLTLYYCTFDSNNHILADTFRVAN